MRKALPVLGQVGSAPSTVDAATFGAVDSTHDGHSHAPASSDGQPAGGSGIPASYRELQEWVGTCLERLEGLPDEATRAAVFELLEAVDTLHREALVRLIGLLSAADTSSIRRLAADPIVRSLLELYDVLPADRLAEVAVALTEVTPYIASHGGTLEIIGVEGGAVTVRLTGSCEDCPGSSVTLKRVVEQALRDGLSWFSGLVVVEPEKVPEVKASALPGPREAAPSEAVVSNRPLRRPRWVAVGRLADQPDGSIRVVRPEGLALLLIRSGSEVYAYADGCPPGSPLTLQLARIEANELVCPWHDCRYDVRTGRRGDSEGRLVVYPVAVQDGEIRLALGTEEVTVT